MRDVGQNDLTTFMITRVNHVLQLVVANQAESRAERTLEDLQRMLFVLLDRRRKEIKPQGLDDVEAP
ncbi:hypothetical protein [Microbulbifer epialgicus]|uniref:hypothetical protein n=1 Tax=Microbulbifer epialgicus TaxID=393907 RepID=UPI003530B19F